jgi:hypothetical protein
MKQRRRLQPSVRVWGLFFLKKKFLHISNEEFGSTYSDGWVLASNHPPEEAELQKAVAQESDSQQAQEYDQPNAHNPSTPPRQLPMAPGLQ